MTASPSSSSPDNLDVLISAAANGDVGQVEQWLEQWQNSTDPSPPRGPPKQPMLPLQPVLYRAARGNHTDIVNLLLVQGCEIDPRTIVSVSAGNATDVYQLLLNRGWDINLSLGHIGDALILATGANKTALVQFLIAHGADPNTNLCGNVHTALECAAYSASIAVLELLIDAGAQIASRSALSIAAHEGRVLVVKYLLDRGANIDEIPDNEDIYENESKFGVKNALCSAAAAGKAEVVVLLLECGADKKIKDTLGRNALKLAEMNGHEDCVSVLSCYEI